MQYHDGREFLEGLVSEGNEELLEVVGEAAEDDVVLHDVLVLEGVEGDFFEGHFVLGYVAVRFRHFDVRVIASILGWVIHKGK
jgi:hypothetical protein